MVSAVLGVLVLGALLLSFTVFNPLESAVNPVNFHGVATAVAIVGCMTLMIGKRLPALFLMYTALAYIPVYIYLINYVPQIPFSSWRQA